MYYNPNKTLSRQRLFNFVVGPRGTGKSYGAKKRAITNYLKKGEQFVYLRRYETELPSAEMINFFDDVGVEFPDTEFKSYNGLFRIDNKVAGWYFPLSKATMLKSIPFPNVSLIIFDEFIIEVGIYRYLPNEVRTFLECYSTISRDRDVPVLFLSNAITMTNPYFIYFNIHMEPGQTVKLLKHISVELIRSPEFEKHMQNTKFGELISGTEYGKYNIQNEFLLDTSTFLEDMPAGASYVCTFVIDGKRAGFYVSNQEMKWYISEKTDPACKRVYALTFSEHDQNTILAHRANPYIQQMLDSFCNGNLRFTTQKIKNICSPTLRRLL